jgi:hypothetical protein
MKKILCSLYKGIKSRLFVNKVEDWAKERMDICRICIHNSGNSLKKTRREKLAILVNTVFNYITFRKVKTQNICNICLCNLTLKTEYDSEDCSDTPKKWTSIYIENGSKVRNNK